MVARSVVIEHQAAALRQIRAVIEKHDPAAVEQLRRLTPGGGIPNSVKSPDEVMLFLAQSVAVLAERVDGLLEQTRPRPRGRPPKSREKSDG